MYHVIAKSHKDENFKDYVTKKPVSKSEANLILEVTGRYLDPQYYVELEPVNGTQLVMLNY